MKTGHGEMALCTRLAGISKLPWKPPSSSRRNENCVCAMWPGIPWNQISKWHLSFCIHWQQPRQTDWGEQIMTTWHTRTLWPIITQPYKKDCYLKNTILTKIKQIPVSKPLLISPAIGSNCNGQPIARAEWQATAGRREMGHRCSVTFRSRETLLIQQWELTPFCALGPFRGQTLGHHRLNSK